MNPLSLPSLPDIHVSRGPIAQPSLTESPNLQRSSPSPIPNIELQPFTSRLGRRGGVGRERFRLVGSGLSNYLLSRLLNQRRAGREDERRESEENRIASLLFRESEEGDEEEIMEDFIESESSEDDDPSSLQTFDVPHDWQEIKEIDDNPVAYVILEKYGPLAMLLFAKMKKYKMSKEIKDSETFISELLDFINKNYLLINSDEITETISNLSELIPSISAQKEILKNNKNDSNMLTIFKVMIDAMEIQCKLCDKPLFCNYLNNLIPYAINFYYSLRTEDIEDIEKILLKLAGKKEFKGIKIFKTKKEYIKYYEKEQAKYINLAEGNSIEIFFI